VVKRDYLNEPDHELSTLQIYSVAYEVKHEELRTRTG